MCWGDGLWIPEKHLELVPEEPEFEYGEMIEVSTDNEHWLKRMFVAKSSTGMHVCVNYTCEHAFINGRPYTTNFYKYARKLKPQLTRKEIAEKFWVNEDFTLVD